MPEPTRCASSYDFLVSISPALSAVLSGIGLWVASQARTTSKVAQRTSQALAKTYATPSPGHSVIVSDEVVQALRKPSSRAQDPSA
jgi:hypothetical protein